jgi:hypothetical protein
VHPAKQLEKSSIFPNHTPDNTLHTTQPTATAVIPVDMNITIFTHQPTMTQTPIPLAPVDQGLNRQIVVSIVLGTSAVLVPIGIFLMNRWLKHRPRELSTFKISVLSLTSF